MITAAHCRLDEKDLETLVRVGEWNFRTSPDCDVNGLCNPKEFEVNVNKWISHPKYDKHSNENDIALVRLSRSITFHYGHEIGRKKDLALAEPACLPFFPKLKEINPNTPLEVVGWGKLKN